MSVPINVTEKTPIIIPRAVSSDLTLFAKTAIKEIFKFSKKKREHYFLTGSSETILPSNNRTMRLEYLAISSS